MPATAPGTSRLPRAIWALGFVSLLMDISSELIHSLLPVFMVTTLGTSMLVVGLVEGVAEATALIVKVFSGVLSDWWGRRKPLAILGYGLGAASKPLFALATTAGLVLGARLIDRVGKGIRGAPRDALVADLAPPTMRGEAFGLRQSLDTVGSFLGPLLAIALMLLWGGDFRAVFWVAVIPAVLCVTLLVVGVREPDAPARGRRTNPISRENLRRLPPAYWWVVAVGAVFTLARFSEAFLVLRAQQGGLPVAWAPLVLIAMNVVYAAGAYPFGRLADRMDRTRLLAGGLVLLVAADLLLARGRPRPAAVGGHPAVGAAHGDDPGPARHDGGRRRARGLARHGLRHVQPGQRHRPAGGQCPRRLAVGHLGRRHAPSSRVRCSRSPHWGCCCGAGRRPRPDSRPRPSKPAHPDPHRAPRAVAPRQKLSRNRLVALDGTAGFSGD